MTPHTLDRRADTMLGPADRRIDGFFRGRFGELVEAHGPIAAAGYRALGARPITVEVNGAAWSIYEDAGTRHAVEGRLEGAGLEGALELSLTEAQFADWAQGLVTLTALQIGGDLVRAAGRQRDVGYWDSLWLALLVGWPVDAPDLTFTDRSGAPLDLQRCFTPADDPTDIAHFLREAGFVHLRGWLDLETMATIANDMDVAAVHHYRQGDGRSWWATTSDGTARCVRMLHFYQHSAATDDLLTGPVFASLRQMLGPEDTYLPKPREDTGVEALVKPLGVVEGISDVPWHRDCHFGRHAQRCASMTVGISVTGADKTSGQLRVVAGSHRVNMPADVASFDPYLPILELPTRTGDLTVHLSCTLHESTPPTTKERKVLYTDFVLAPRPEDQTEADQVAALRQRVHTEVSQAPSPVSTTS